MDRREREIADWLFAMGEDTDCLAHGTPVSIPHTWSVDETLEDYKGPGWYRTWLPPCGAGEVRSFLTFRGAYRDAEVWVNGKAVGSHKGAGYTPFGLEITDALCLDGSGEVTVRVDNRFSTEALPYDRSFDWACDGGLYRPVTLRRTGPTALLPPEITAQPVLPQDAASARLRVDRCPAAFSFHAAISSSDRDNNGWRLRWSLKRQEEAVAAGELPAGENGLPLYLLPEVHCWHFDCPELYTLCLTILDASGAVSDEREVAFGFRQLRVCPDALLFNGESVRMPGMEWMPGSNPDFGMAEPWVEQEKWLRLLKESNTVLTRFHWQQDERVLDWCDRHGLLVQEELPFWGKQPEADPDRIWPVAQGQLREMVEAHRHHPSIVAWGVGNELSAFEEQTRLYIRRAVAEVRRLDPTRLVNYVTNTAFAHPFDDGTGEGDVLMINDYIGTWHQGFEQESAWQALIDAHPGRLFVPSEFGLCEPAFPGGDPERERIFLTKLAFYRRHPAIVGTVYFCLNDYRTHMGEDGSGRLRRRVHGSTDWRGQPKPSYGTVRRESSPLTVEVTGQGLLVRVREDLPRYEARGYLLTDGAQTVPIPILQPSGQREWLCPVPLRPAGVRILRPTGETAFILQEDAYANDRNPR